MFRARRAAAWLGKIFGVAPERAMQRRVSEVRQVFAAIFLRPVAEILLLRSAASGVLLWLVLASEPRLAMAGLLGIGLGETFRRLLGIDDAGGFDGCLKANAFLAAVATAWLTRAAGLGFLAEVGLILSAAALAAILGGAIKRALDPTTLPPLVWAYCIVAGLFFTLFPEWTLRAAVAMDWGKLPTSALDWFLLSLRALGAFLFLPTPWAGLLIATAILLWSRVMFLYGLVGWVAGVLTAQGFLSLGTRFFWLPVSYNFFIAGMALGAVRFLPCRAGFGIAAVAGAFAAVAAIGLQYLFDGSAAAYLPISFGLTVWVGIGALHSAGQRGLLWLNAEPDLPPEDAWRKRAIDILRWGHREPLLAVPVGGAVAVIQGFSGRLSHAGPWRHALDLQRPLPAGGSEKGRESLWGAPVFAPAPGIVDRVRGDVPDNPLGISNFAENWGNHVIIWLDQGAWAMIAHLQQGSVAVLPGNRVSYGNYLGAVGNSGRSPSPHLHLQAQRTGEPGAPTRRFRLANYLTEAAPGKKLLRWHAAEVPEAGTILAAARPNPVVHALLVSMAPGTAIWSVEATGEIPPAFAMDGVASVGIEVSLDEAGRYHHACHSGAGELISRLDPDGWRPIEMTHHPVAFLTLLALAVPAVPYAAVVGMTWEDITLLVPPGSGGPIGRALLPFRKNPFVAVHCHCEGTPDLDEPLLSIKSEPGKTEPGLPECLVTAFAMTRGPVSLTATFATGSLVFSMLSFEPRLPLRDSRAADRLPASH